MLTCILQGLALGFAAGAQPGPFQTYLISQALRHGWRRTLVAAFAPLISDGPIVTVVIVVLSQIPDWFQRVLQIVGGFFVLYLAWGAFKAWKDFTSEIESARQVRSQSLLRAALMNALSPGPYLFWSLVIGPLIVTAWRQNPYNALTIAVCFYIAMIGINALIITLIGLAARFGDHARRAMLGISVVALTAFGVYQLWQGVIV
jgi:threonine/homoserine/homoserine lactone efflux protein